MLLERVYDPDLSQASYLVGCQATGEAAVVDPRRDIDVYQDIASRNGMRIVAVTETHIHADYLSGTRELAAATGAEILVSDEGGPDWRYGTEFDGAVRMRHGHRFAVGNITIEAVHTPGHTPEHLSFLVTDGAQSASPGFMLTGDFVFVGDLGRPDLLDEAAGYSDTRFALAKQLFASLRDRFLTLPDYVQVLPGHGAGSACGRALGAVPATTVGYERHFAWWARHLAADDESGFVAELLSGQPDAHAYFARMKRENREGPALLGELPTLPELQATELQAALAAERAILIDTRDHAAVHAGTVPGAINIPGTSKAASYGAWAIDPETSQLPLIALASSAEDAAELRAHLIRVGIDTLSGYVTGLDGLGLALPDTIEVDEISAVERSVLLDVRGRTEFADGTIPGAVNISAGQILWRLGEIPTDGRIILFCRSGVRGSVIASALRRTGRNVTELAGSYSAWESRQRSAA